MMTRSRPGPGGAISSRFTLSVKPEAGPIAAVGVTVGWTGVAVFAGKIGVGFGPLHDTDSMPAVKAMIKNQVREIKRHLHC
jgi:hypothetical protein